MASGGYQPFRELAEALAARGIALLRYDKRGIGGSSRGVRATTEALAEDVRAMLRFLRGRSDIAADRIAFHMLVDDADGTGRRWLSLPSRRVNADALRLLSDWVAEQVRR